MSRLMVYPLGKGTVIFRGGGSSYFRQSVRSGVILTLTQIRSELLREKQRR